MLTRWLVSGSGLVFVICWCCRVAWCRPDAPTRLLTSVTWPFWTEVFLLFASPGRPVYRVHFSLGFEALLGKATVWRVGQQEARSGVHSSPHSLCRPLKGVTQRPAALWCCLKLCCTPGGPSSVSLYTLTKGAPISPKFIDDCSCVFLTNFMIS